MATEVQVLNAAFLTHKEADYPAWSTLEPSSLCNTYNVWQDSGETCAASTAMTDHYSAAYEACTDSGLSEQDVGLACDELLCNTSNDFLDSQQGPQQLQQVANDQLWHKQKRHSSSCTTSFVPQLGQLVGAPCRVREVAQTIRNEMEREAGTRPCSNYFKRHAFLTCELREIAVSWAIQVVDQFRQQQETLFLAISYLDRFLSSTQEVVHMDGLHLATLACLALAAKQTEVVQPTTAEWAALVSCNNWGTKEQVARMEWIIMDCLDWRGCTPTSWWFLHLFCYGLGTCPAPAICMSAYLLELAMLDASSLSYSYSSLAAAALLLGHTTVEVHAAGGGVLQPLTAQMLQCMAPDLNLHQVHAACKWLADLHSTACQLPEAQPDTPVQGLQLARSKYCTDVWHNVGAWLVRLDLNATLERF